MAHDKVDISDDDAARMPNPLVSERTKKVIDVFGLSDPNSAISLEVNVTGPTDLPRKLVILRIKDGNVGDQIVQIVFNREYFDENILPLIHDQLRLQDEAFAKSENKYAGTIKITKPSKLP